MAAIGQAQKDFATKIDEGRQVDFRYGDGSVMRRRYHDPGCQRHKFRFTMASAALSSV